MKIFTVQFRFFIWDKLWEVHACISVSHSFLSFTIVTEASPLLFTRSRPVLIIVTCDDNTNKRLLVVVWTKFYSSNVMSK